MGKIYKNQSKLRITRTAGVDITGATSTLIKYKKPDNTAGSWTASVLTAATGVIYYDVLNSTILDMTGKWVTWAYVTFSDGRSAPGVPVSFMVSEEGT